MEFPLRINKYLALKKIASRREADALIMQKQVMVNGQPAEIGQQIQKDDDVVVKGAIKAKQYFAYYKGRGIITHSPAKGEIDIASKISADYGLTDISPIGRLDKDSEGLIILSNDGRITGPLLDPDSENEKEYEVLVDKTVSGMIKKVMEKGVNIEGYKTKPTKITISQKNKKRFNIVLTEGKKHQIRRMCAALGLQVQALKRVRITNIELGKLKPNQYRKISGPELKEFLNHLDLT